MQRPKNLKLKTESWNDEAVGAFLSFCTAYCLCSQHFAPTARENGSKLKIVKEDHHWTEEDARVNEEGGEGKEGKKGCYKSQHSESKHSSETKP